MDQAALTNIALFQATYKHMENHIEDVNVWYANFRRESGNPSIV